MDDVGECLLRLSGLIWAFLCRRAFHFVIACKVFSRIGGCGREIRISTRLEAIRLGYRSREIKLRIRVNSRAPV